MSEIRNFNPNRKKTTVQNKSKATTGSVNRINDIEDYDDYEEEENDSGAGARGKKNGLASRIWRHRLTVFYRTVLIILVVAVIVIIYILYEKNKIYTDYSITTQAEWTNNSSIKILNYNGNILTYSKDGAVCTSLKGKTLWNQSYEMQNPIVAIRGDYVAIGDYNGTTIYVMDSTGQQGAIDTRLPIRSLDISAKGTVLAVVDDSPLTWVYLYSKSGEVIVTEKTSMSLTGYPLATTISDDSRMFAAAYLYTDSGNVTTKVAFYNLDEVGENYQDYLVSGFDYNDAIVPMVRFMTNDTSFAVADNRLMIYSGKQIPASTKEIILSEDVRSVYYSSSYIGLVYLNTDGDTKYRMDVYGSNGALNHKYEFDQEYKDIVFFNELIYIYNEESCLIYNMEGVQKYAGDFNLSVELLIPAAEKNRIILIGKNMIETITLE